MTAAPTAPGPSASLRVARLMAISLGIAGIMLMVLETSVIRLQWDALAPWWSIGTIAAVAGASAAVAVVGAVGSDRATTVSFVVLAGALLVPAVVVFAAVAPGGLTRYPWLADLAVIGAAAAGAGLPARAAIGYLTALLAAFAVAAVVLVRPEGRLDGGMHVLALVFYTAMFMALAIASRRAGRQLDAAIRSAVAEISAAAAAEARRAERRRIAGLIHDSVIVALLAFGRGAPGEPRVVRQAQRALAAIEDLDASAASTGDATPRELAWRLQAITTELGAEIRFDYTADDEGSVPAVVVEAAAEAMSEAIRNSLRHAGLPGQGSARSPSRPGPAASTSWYSTTGSGSTRPPCRRPVSASGRGSCAGWHSPVAARRC